MVFKKGHTPWNKETKGIVKSNSGSFKKGHKMLNGSKKGWFEKEHKLSKELEMKRRKNISKSLTGKKLTEEQIRKTTETRKNNGWFKNLEETKRKMRKPHKSPPPRSEEHRKNQREAQKKYLKEHPEEIERLKKQRAKIVLPVKDTKIEVKIQNFLKQLGIEFFTHQYMKQISHAYQCDILIPSMNLVIECDGDYWHKYPVGRDIDHIRTKELIQKGFKVLRLWENEIKEMDVGIFKNIVLNKNI